MVDKVNRFVNTRNILVVSQASDGRGIEALQLIGSPLGKQRTHIAVNHIPGNEDEIGLLGIDHVHPAAHLGARIVETGMKVAQHHNFQWPSKVLVGRNLDFLALFVMVVDIAADEGYQHDAGNNQ